MPTATAATGTAPPVVVYGFGSGRPLTHPFVRSKHYREHNDRDRPPTVATVPTPAPSPVPTVPTASDREHAQPVAIHLRILPPLLHPVHRDDWLGCSWCCCRISVWIFCHAFIARRLGAGAIQRAHVPGHDAIHFSRPDGCSAHRTFTVFLLPSVSSFLEMHETAGKGHLQTTGSGSVLLVREPTPPPPT